MGEINYDVDFVERTKHVLAEYDGEYRLTVLLNCLIGLIILPNERSQRNIPELWNINIEDIPLCSDLKINIFNPIKGRNRNTGEITYYPKTLKIFLKKMRNGIVHQHIEAINEKSFFVGVKISNLYDSDCDLEVEFRREELTKFALFIADQYLLNAGKETQTNVRNKI